MIRKNSQDQKNKSTKKQKQKSKQRIPQHPQKQKQKQPPKQTKQQSSEKPPLPPSINSTNSSNTVKKTKSGFAKIRSTIQHTVNAKKLLQLIKKSTRTIPQLLTRQESKALLPKLERIILTSPFHGENQGNSTSRAKFQEIQDQLTHSMVMFKKNAQKQRNDLWAIDLQTQKCYKTIPSFYFKQHMNSEELTRNLTLTKNPKQMQQNMLTLSDFLDQVQFNINEQANAKIKMFMNFVICTNSIQDLININLEKLKATRKHIVILRDIVVSRSVRINQHRLEKQRIQETLDFMNLLKKMKGMENKLNSHISIGGFISHDQKSKLGALFNSYCELHNEELKKFCCKNGKNLCKYWDITYYVERGYQDNFIKIVKSYLFQLINYHRQVQNFKKSITLTINKKSFMTTPTNPHPSSSTSPLTDPNHLDQSFNVDDIQHVQLISKVHIEKEILSLFEQGMERYSFSTEGLEKDLADMLAIYINNFLKEALGAADPEPRITLRDLTLTESQETNYLETQKCRQKLFKISWPHFSTLADMITQRLQYLTIRLLSLSEKLLQKISSLKQTQPERYQVFSAYMCQLLDRYLALTDQYLATLLKNRVRQDSKSLTLFKSKDEIVREFDVECENMKKIVRYCNRWLGHIGECQTNYRLVVQQFTRTVVAKSKKTIPSPNPQPLPSLWCPKLQQLKTTLVKNTYQLLHKTIISRDLRQKLEQDRWQFIEIKTSIYSDLGYIIGGKEFIVEEERNQHEMLSKSILMERSMTAIERANGEEEGGERESKQTKYKKQQYSSRFKINPNYITLGTQKFKLTSSSQHIILFLRKYLQLFDDIPPSQPRRKSDLQAKLTQTLLMYNQYLKDLILKGEAIKLEKIKSKSITAKHLVIAYMQLGFMEFVFGGVGGGDEILAARVGMGREDFGLMREKIGGTMGEIRRKYQKIIEMRIMDTIENINLKDQNWLQSEPILSIPRNIHASIQLFNQLMLNQSEYEKFIDMEPNWAAELLSKVSKGPRGKEFKIKCFTFLIEEIKPVGKFVPRLMTAIRSVL